MHASGCLVVYCHSLTSKSQACVVGNRVSTAVLPVTLCVAKLDFCFSLVTAILTCFSQGDFSVPDVPKSMAWCENSICVGFKRDYYLIRVRLAYGIQHLRRFE